MDKLLSHYYAGNVTDSDRSTVDRPFRARRAPADEDASHDDMFDYRRAQLIDASSRRSGQYSDSDAGEEPEYQSSAVRELTRAERNAYAEHLVSLEARENYSSARHHLSSGEEPTAERALHDRTSKWQDRVKSSTATLRKDLEGLRNRECTFSPAINRGYRPTRYAASQHDRNLNDTDITVSDESQDDNGAVPQTPVFHRLFEHKSQILQRRQAAAAERAAAEVRECSFKPRVVKAPWTAGVQPRYLDAKADDHDDRSSSAMTTTLRGFGEQGLAHVSSSGAAYGAGITPRHRGSWQTADDSQHTFRPVTNQHVPAFVSEYLKQPVHERLSRSPAVGQRPHVEAPTDGSPLRPTVHRRAITPAQRRDFERRLEEDIARRKQAQEQQKYALERESTPSFQPSINRFAKIDSLTAEERAKLVEIRRDKLDRERQRITQELYPSQPRAYVSKESLKYLANRPAEHAVPLAQRYVEDMRRKTEKIENAKKQRLEEELKGLQAVPKISDPPADSKVAVVGSELGRALAGSLEDYKRYLHRLEDARSTSEVAAKTAAEERIKEELKECTGKPTIHDAPEYVKQIVQARSAARRPSTARARGGSVDSTSVLVI